MRALESIFFETRESFHQWLEQNHDKSPGIHIICYKNHSGVQCISYRDALLEALCFGWIDSTVRTLDHNRYLRMFTPRRNTSNWSEVNQKLVMTLIGEGKMTEAGLKKIDSYLKTGRVEWPAPEGKTGELTVPAFILDELGQNEPALSHFNQLSKTNKRYLVGWITSAKRPETIQKRIMESIALLKENKKPGTQPSSLNDKKE
ncbi:MAG TPA: YdeI/OmpD-associated family protein [Prolixibacteraceae bacterium]|nr:YdeI/OmpD-associated family protein [Prolixibacteraceae bacterium]